MTEQNVSCLLTVGACSKWATASWVVLGFVCIPGGALSPAATPELKKLPLGDERSQTLWTFHSTTGNQQYTCMYHNKMVYTAVGRIHITSLTRVSASCLKIFRAFTKCGCIYRSSTKYRKLSTAKGGGGVDLAGHIIKYTTTHASENPEHRLLTICNYSVPRPFVLVIGRRLSQALAILGRALIGVAPVLIPRWRSFVQTCWESLAVSWGE